MENADISKDARRSMTTNCQFTSTNSKQNNRINPLVNPLSKMKAAFKVYGVTLHEKRDFMIDYKETQN